MDELEREDALDIDPAATGLGVGDPGEEGAPADLPNRPGAGVDEAGDERGTWRALGDVRGDAERTETEREGGGV